MLDFTSALYLGLRHASDSLRPWARLTAGVPAALASPPLAGRIAGELAGLTGVERATLARSTLHAFWDLFIVFGRRNGAIYVDAGSYPIARWGVERAAATGVPARTFAHHDAGDLRRRLGRDARSGRQPLVLADGFCPSCGAAAPIREYLAAVREHGGRLVLDDTQALGILGESPGRSAPYGSGGGGSLRWAGVRGPDILVVSSLAKGFGAPLAVVSGGEPDAARFEALSETRVHTSPPSFADLRAAERALELNRSRGDVLRVRLAQLVRKFRSGLFRLGLPIGRSLFPVQSLGQIPGLDTRLLHSRLSKLGIRTALHQSRCRSKPQVSFLITAAHSPADIEHALEALAGLVDRRRDPAPSSASVAFARA